MSEYYDEIEPFGFESPPVPGGQDESPWDDEEEDDTLEPTFWVLDREPGMDDLATTEGENLKKMQDDLKIFPFQDLDGNDRLFLARFEFPNNGEEFQFPEAVFAEDKTKASGWIDFLAGFPVDCCEMLLAIGEYSTKPDKIYVKDGEGKAAAPVPEKFFIWPETDKILFNLTALPTPNVGKIMAENLEGEPKPENAHWWFRVNLGKPEEDAEGQKWPVPGEFLGLGVRLMPTVTWGKQKSSPFIWSGNWMDTVFYTGAIITEIIDPTDDVPYPTYKVRWRKDEITVNPSDFAEYAVGNRVTILKDVDTDKTTQLWKDNDTQQFGDNFQIVPVTFYGLEMEE